MRKILILSALLSTSCGNNQKEIVKIKAYYQPLIEHIKTCEGEISKKKIAQQKELYINIRDNEIVKALESKEGDYKFEYVINYKLDNNLCSKIAKEINNE